MSDETLEELITPLTRQQCETAFYAGLATRGTSVTSWKPGAWTRTAIVVLSIVLAAFSSFVALLARSGFLGHAVGAWLSLVARYVYGQTRIPAQFASGEVELTNAGGGIYIVAAGELTVSNGQYSYVNTEAFTLNGLSSVVVDIVAVEAGSASSTGADTITTLVTVLDGVTCNNDQALVGLDEETDAELQRRCSESLGAT